MKNYNKILSEGDYELARIFGEPLCLQCGVILEDLNCKFCSQRCEDEYDFENRTCPICGGEFWDGGTSCDCDENTDECFN